MYTVKKRKQRCVYTVITQGYDDLRQPAISDERYDYICFCNDKSEGFEGIWEIRHFDCEKQNEWRSSRRPKMKPHELLSEYEFSLYIDANVEFQDRLIYDCIDNLIERDVKIAHVDHIWRQCMYMEINFCVIKGFDTFLPLCKTYLRAYKSGFPYNAGLFENNIIFRQHNDPKVIEAGCRWWESYINLTKRDQCLLMSIYWELGIIPDLLLPAHTNSRNSKHVTVLEHNPGKDMKNNHNKMAYRIFRYQVAFLHGLIKLLSLFSSRKPNNSRLLLHNGYNGPDESSYN